MVRLRARRAARQCSCNPRGCPCASSKVSATCVWFESLLIHMLAEASSVACTVARTDLRTEVTTEVTEQPTAVPTRRLIAPAFLTSCILRCTNELRFDTRSLCFRQRL